MSLPERRGERRHHAEHGRDCGDSELSGKSFLQRIDLVAHGARVADDAARPFQRALALRREANKTRAALHQRDAEHLLELFQAGRHGRLRHAARLRGPPEMLFPGERQQEFEFVDQGRVSDLSAGPRAFSIRKTMRRSACSVISTRSPVSRIRLGISITDSGSVQCTSSRSPGLSDFSALRVFSAGSGHLSPVRSSFVCAMALQHGEPDSWRQPGRTKYASLQIRLAWLRKSSVSPGATCVTSSPSSTSPSVSTSDDSKPAPSRGNLTASSTPSCAFRKLTRTYSRRAIFFR